MTRNYLKFVEIYEPSGSNCEGFVAAIFDQINSARNNREMNASSQAKAVERWTTSVTQTDVTCVVPHYLEIFKVKKYPPSYFENYRNSWTNNNKTKQNTKGIRVICTIPNISTERRCSRYPNHNVILFTATKSIVKTVIRVCQTRDKVGTSIFRLLKCSNLFVR